MATESENIIEKLSRYRTRFSSEKEMQLDVSNLLPIILESLDIKLPISREHRLDSKNVIDFMSGGIGIECKIKQSSMAVYRQLERYSDFDSIKELVLITSKVHCLPPVTKNGKRILVLNTAKAWL
jgi:hypothetical protein